LDDYWFSRLVIASPAPMGVQLTRYQIDALLDVLNVLAHTVAHKQKE
jgi:hypothetical protein